MGNMDKLGNLVKKERAGMSLHKSSQALSKSNDEYSITTYTGELTQENVVRNFARIKACFPAISPEFYKILLERLKEKGFSDERLSDSVNNLIYNFQYPNPTLANILSFDRKVKILDYNQVCKLIGKHEATFNDFSKIYIDEKMFYVRKSEKEFYKIPDRL